MKTSEDISSVPPVKAAAVSARENVARALGEVLGTSLKDLEVRGKGVWAGAEAGSIRRIFSEVKAKWPELHLSAITGLDVGEGIEVIYHFVLDKVLVNVRTRVDRDQPKAETIADFLPAADSYERELHDILGVEFPERKETPRLVLPDTWQEGVYPLRNEPSGGGQGV